MSKTAEILIEEQKLEELEQELKNIEILVKKQRKKVLFMRLLERLQLEELKNVDLY